MSYLVFARKFRPQTFDDVVGQETSVTTLKNAITEKRIPQNFLFSGPRGVGKTSMARILAKCLNCQKGPTVEPCLPAGILKDKQAGNECISCKEITQGNSLDVLEIDGASNRGIDEIRNLRETVKFKPVAGHFKIYIIDEVHMLTTEAFNALLKTLEEPPPHVKFIFATTESHKMPLTILSRCQRFHFKRISSQGIVEKLTEIAKAEKISYEKDVLFWIAKASDGALRDAEGLLDQLVSFSDGKIKEKDVLALLGMTPESDYFSLLDSIRRQDVKAIFSTLQKLCEEGKDLNQFSLGLFEILRHLLLLQSFAPHPSPLPAGEGKGEGIDEFVDVSEENLKALKARKNLFSRSELLLALNILTNLQNQLKRQTASPKLLIEAALLKLIHLSALESVQKILSEQGSVTPSASRPPAAYSAEGRSSSLTLRSSSSEALAKEGTRPNGGPGTGASAPAVSRSMPAATAPLPKKEIPVMNPGRFESASKNPVKSAEESGPALSFQEIESAWPRIVEYVKSKRMSNGIFLSESSPIDISGGVVTLGFPPEFQFHKDMLEKEPSRQLIEEAFEVCLGRKLRVSLAVTKAEKATKVNPEAPVTEASNEENVKLPEIISEAMNIFDGARIVRKDA